MKKSSLLVPVLAAIALFAQPVFAEHVQPSDQSVQAAPQAETAAPAEKTLDHESMMQESMKKMQAQMAAIHQTKDPKKRQKLLQEHSRSMRDSARMMREMMGGMAMGGPMMGGQGCPMMGGQGCPMMAGHAMGGSTGAAPAAQADQKAAADKVAPEGKVWTCPMHPNVVQDHPGTCPICGMDLVEKGSAGSGNMMGCPMMGGQGCSMMGGQGCSMMGGQGCPMMGGQGCPMMSGHTMGATAPAGDNTAASPAAQAPGKTAAADPAPAGDGKKIWTCPMHPDVVSDQPGICPKCGMELVELDPSGAAPSGQMGGCMMGGGMKGGGMMGMHDRHMGLMLMLMEQMIEHNDAATGIRK